jgi:hypothetical protein
MKYIKHFIKVARWTLIRSFCKHSDAGVASCPFTRMTYTTCHNCGKRLDVRPTNDSANPTGY